MAFAGFGGRPAFDLSRLRQSHRDGRLGRHGQRQSDDLPFLRPGRRLHRADPRHRDAGGPGAHRHLQLQPQRVLAGRRRHRYLRGARRQQRLHHRHRHDPGADLADHGEPGHPAGAERRHAVLADPDLDWRPRALHLRPAERHSAARPDPEQRRRHQRHAHPARRLRLHRPFDRCHHAHRAVHRQGLQRYCQPGAVVDQPDQRYCHSERCLFADSERCRWRRTARISTRNRHVSGGYQHFQRRRGQWHHRRSAWQLSRNPARDRRQYRRRLTFRARELHPHRQPPADRDDRGVACQRERGWRDQPDLHGHPQPEPVVADHGQHHHRRYRHVRHRLHRRRRHGRHPGRRDHRDHHHQPERRRHRRSRRNRDPHRRRRHRLHRRRGPQRHRHHPQR